MKTLTVERTIWIAAPRKRVWRAITDAEELTKWFAPGSKWEIPALKIGGKAKFYNTDTDIAFHTIEVVDPPREFSLSWEEQGRPMLTTFTLEEEDNGTRVIITEAGFELLPEKIRQKRFDQTTAGYEMSLNNLKAYLEVK